MPVGDTPARGVGDRSAAPAEHAVAVGRAAEREQALRRATAALDAGASRRDIADRRDESREGQQLEQHAVRRVRQLAADEHEVAGDVRREQPDSATKPTVST